MQQYGDLFSGIGKIKDVKISLHIDPDVKPKQQKHRRIPFHTRKDVERELRRLEDADIIERIDGPTPWVSPILVVPKPSGEIRICVDMREANRAVQRERHPMPTLDDIITDLNGCTVFSTLDMTAGYHQFELEEECRNITTFSTHVGLFRYKRLMFGINAASEIFQSAVAQLLTGLSGCRNVSDDILVYGKDQQEHDRNLKAVLDRLQSHNARLNKSKCKFAQPEVKFYGHTFSGDGIAPDPKKIEALINATAPKNAKEVKSFLGLASYVSRFIPNYATVTNPLRALTHQDSKWKWEQEEISSFNELKSILTNTNVMVYFDPRKPTDIIVDASPVGLGAMLSQDGKIVSYASRTLSDVESRYSQTEREMLGVVWAVERFHLYVFGAHFRIITDHKPLLGIFKSSRPTSARIDRWRLRTMSYDCDIVYKPGKDDENPADFISRHPGSQAPNKSVAEDYINYICNNAVPKALTLEDVRAETAKDGIMQKLMTTIQSGKSHDWDDVDMRPYKPVRSELTICNGAILRGNRLTIPASLQPTIIELAHASHQGIVKTKSLIREKVWFPGIDRMVEDKVKQCLPCQAATTNSAERPEPLKMTPLPSAPWKEVAVDFTGPYASGEYLLVVVDEYSRFPEVEIVSSTSARATIPKLNAIFARQGIPDIVKTDNGPPFHGHEFAKFASYLGFTHRRVTPLWPRANGEVERLNRTLGKVIRIAETEGVSWKQQLHRFLRQYRATPHSSTNLSPSEALNSRKLKCELPEIQSPKRPYSRDDSLQERDAQQKSKMKTLADTRLFAKPSNIQTGDVVLVRQPKQSKHTSPFNPKPFQVTMRRGNMVEATRGDKVTRRNVSHFKKVQTPPPDPHTLEDDNSDDPTDDIPLVTDSQPSQDPQSLVKSPAVLEDSPKLKSSLRQSTRVRKPPVRFKDYVQ
ncbi:uncharacterized protein K02A2.6-like [Patiria miniata]|uniref:Uncharacterized protein n=1 Tax=Patiria miniata TaxID=46514 RepID=A0A914AHQ3_PATMI|nr:uncharacterized protein K02A2.6-like [Patiria miniata]